MHKEANERDARGANDVDKLHTSPSALGVATLQRA